MCWDAVLTFGRAEPVGKFSWDWMLMGYRFQARSSWSWMSPLLNQPLAFGELSDLRPLWFSPIQQFTEACKTIALWSAQGDTTHLYTKGTHSSQERQMGRGRRASLKCREEEEHLVLRIQGRHHQTGSFSPWKAVYISLASMAVPLLFRTQCLLHKIRNLRDRMTEVIESERQRLMRKKHVRKRNRNRGAGR